MGLKHICLENILSKKYFIEIVIGPKMFTVLTFTYTRPAKGFARLWAKIFFGARNSKIYILYEVKILP